MKTEIANRTRAPRYILLLYVLYVLSDDGLLSKRFILFGFVSSEYIVV